jgi:hypothetical protein
LGLFGWFSGMKKEEIQHVLTLSLFPIRHIYSTPLHDACWTSQPCFELIELLITHMSDLLYVSDARGYYPLDYVRKENWDAWIDFLDAHKDYVVPRELYKVPAS